MDLLEKAHDGRDGKFAAYVSTQNIAECEFYVFGLRYEEGAMSADTDT